MRDNDIKNFIIYLSSSIHMARIFQSRSKTLRIHAERTYEILQELFKEVSYVELTMSGGHLFLNDERIKVGMEIMGRYRALIHDLRSLSVGNIIFTEMPSIDEIISFVYVMGKALSLKITSFEKLRGRLDRMGVKSVIIEELEESEEVKEGIVRSVRKQAVTNLFDSIKYLRGVTESFTGDYNVARRLIRKFAELVSEDKGYLLALTTIKNIGSYTLNHSVNVCILSLAMAIELGLSRRDLLEMGIAGLFHDLGKIDIPDEILNKPDSLTNLEYEKVKQHPYLSAERILFLRGMEEVPIFALRGILEHHIDYSGGGYPLIKIKSPCLFARILRIVDSYDAMTTPRIYQAVSTPFDALKYIVANKGVYDPSLVKVFLDVVGIYPPGTIVGLKGGTRGVMLSQDLVAVVGGGGELETLEGATIEKALSPDEVEFDPAAVVTTLGYDEDTAGL